MERWRHPLCSYEANVYNIMNKKAYGLLFSVVVQSAPTAIYWVHRLAKR